MWSWLIFNGNLLWFAGRIEFFELASSVESEISHHYFYFGSWWFSNTVFFFVYNWSLILFSRYHALLIANLHISLLADDQGFSFINWYQLVDNNTTWERLNKFPTRSALNQYANRKLWHIQIYLNIHMDISAIFDILNFPRFPLNPEEWNSLVL